MVNPPERLVSRKKQIVPSSRSYLGPGLIVMLLSTSTIGQCPLHGFRRFRCVEPCSDAFSPPAKRARVGAEMGRAPLRLVDPAVGLGSRDDPCRSGQRRGRRAPTAPASGRTGGPHSKDRSTRARTNLAHALNPVLPPGLVVHDQLVSVPGATEIFDGEEAVTAGRGVAGGVDPARLAGRPRRESVKYTSPVGIS